MSIRWKLLILMLLVAVVPISFLRCYGSRGIQHLGAELTDQTQQILIENSKRELLLIAQSHGQRLQRERALAELALHYQRMRLQQLLDTDGVELAVPVRPDLPARPHPPKKKGAPPQPSDQQLAVHIPDPLQPLHQRFLGQQEKILALYQEVAKKSSLLVVRQVTVLNGLMVMHPGLDHWPRRFDPTAQFWYSRAIVAPGDTATVWSPPRIDPFSDRFVMTAATKVVSADGRVLGVTSISVPVDTLLLSSNPLYRVASQAKHFMVRIDQTKSSGLRGIQIVAKPEKTEAQPGMGRRFWRAPPQPQWLMEAGDQAAQMLADALVKQHTGVLEVEVEGRPVLLCFVKNRSEGDAALVIMADREKIVRRATDMGGFVGLRIDEVVAFTRYVLMGTFVVVVLMALWLSRTLTHNIDNLVIAVRRVAGGDLNTRSEIRARDEIGELSAAFNRMVPELAESIEMKQSLGLAKEVQQSLLPLEEPSIPGIDVAGESLYCDETGGDLFDYIPMETANGPALGIIVGDVSGHGVSAALLMATVRGLLRSRSEQAGSIKQVMTDTNRLLAADLGDSGQFITLFYLMVDPATRSIEWVRAGHDPAMLYDPETGDFRELSGPGMPLGVEAETVYHGQRLTGIVPGQIIAIGTDGIWEARNPQGQMYGKKRFCESVRKAAGQSAQAIVENVLADLDRFQGAARKMDDVTLVVLKVVDDK